MAKPTPEEATRRRRVRLTYEEMSRHTTWPPIVVEDYLETRQEVTQTSESSLSQQEQVDQNTATNEAQQIEIDSNTLGVTNNANNIAQNTSDISQNATDIDSNTTLINDHINDISDAHDATAISYDNTTSGYTANNAQAAIDEGATNLDTHEALTTAHGVTGDNIGTEDYAQTLIGGAVLLAALVSDVAATTTVIATADVGAAPATYSQAYADEQTALINECKSKINSLVNNDVLDLITQFNDLLSKMKTAKQMSAV